MLTIISGTDRDNSRTLQVANYYCQYLQSKNIHAHLISLQDIHTLKRNDDIKNLETHYLIPSDKFIIIFPEYNGSFPGILKLLFDITDIRLCWWYKKVLLTGVADGRGGNLRGLEHMTNILHYLRMNVHYNKLPLSKINEEMTEAGVFTNDQTIAAIHQQIDNFISY